MHFITGWHNRRSAVIDVAIIDAARHRRHKQNRDTLLTGVRPFKALIDTGATTTMITRRVVEELGLGLVNAKPYVGLHGLAFHDAYLFHVAFYGAGEMAGMSLDDGDQHATHLPADPIRSILIYKEVINGGCIEHDTSFDVLLGMDIISTGDLTIRKDGIFTFVF